LSLEREFYCDDAVFAADMDAVVGRKWLVAGHVDRVRNKGDYFLFKVGNESIIIVRSDESTINAFYNVCRHRGSLICTEPQGKVARLTCGYHAWTYGLDGALLAARLMPADFNKKDNGLHRAHVRVFTASFSSICRKRNRWISTPPSGISRRTWTSTASPTPRSPIPSPTPPRRTGS
jgi:phenylpropionate dioxygenase-like ring-hydroxylating dioxygenase large terminal subunit